VAEADTLHVLVANLDDAFGAQRRERQVFANRPAAALSVARGPGTLLLFGPRPRVVIEGGDQRLHLDEQFSPASSRKGADHADGLELTGVGVEAEQE